jgi:hypothetical protein
MKAAQYDISLDPEKMDITSTNPGIEGCYL